MPGGPNIRLWSASVAHLIGYAVKQARRFGNRYINRRHVEELPDARIHYTIHLGQTQVDLFPKGERSFEFHTSGFPVQTYEFTQDGQTADVYTYGIVTVRFRLTDKTVEHKARFVQNRRYTDDPEHNPTDVGRHGAQAQLASEPAYDRPPRRRKSYEYLTYQTFAPGHSHTFVRERMPLWAGGAGRNDEDRVLWMGQLPQSLGHTQRDFGHDVLPSYTAGSPDESPVRSGVYDATDDDADWPRQFAIQRVEVEDGGTTYTHDFGIYVDASGRWICMPLAAMQNYDYSARPHTPADKYKAVMPTYPPWVWMGGSATMRSQTPGPELGYANPEWQWEFDHEGKRACTVAYKRESMGGYDAAFMATAFPGSTGTGYWNSAQWEFERDVTITSVVAPADSSGLYQFSNASSAFDSNYYFFGPGLLQATLEITLSDPRDAFSFDFDVTIDTVSHPDTALNGVAAAGYLWYPLKGAAADLASPGDLLVFEVESWVPDYDAWINGRPGGTNVILRNLTTEQVIFEAVRGQLLGLDFRTLSFALSSVVLGQATRTLPLLNNQPGSITTPRTGTWLYPTPIMALIVGGKFLKTISPADAHPSALGRLEQMGEEAFLRNRFTPRAGVGRLYLHDRLMTTTRERMAAVGSVALSPPASFAENSAWVKYGHCLLGGFAHHTKIHAISAPPAGGYPGGWLAYAGVVAQTFAARGTPVDDFFWAHPSGSYAVYSTTTWYSRHGVPADASFYRAVTSGGLSASSFRSFVVDEVCIVANDQASEARYASTTTFLELYNEAVEAHVEECEAEGTPTTFQPVEREQTLPTFTLLPAAWDDGYGRIVNTYTLRIETAGGQVRYRPLPAYRSGAQPAEDADANFPINTMWPAWCALGSVNDVSFLDAGLTAAKLFDGAYTSYHYRVASPRLYNPKV